MMNALVQLLAQHIHWLEITAFVVIGGFFQWVFAPYLSRRLTKLVDQDVITFTKQLEGAAERVKEEFQTSLIDYQLIAKIRLDTLSQLNSELHIICELADGKQVLPESQGDYEHGDWGWEKSHCAWVAYQRGTEFLARHAVHLPKHLEDAVRELVENEVRQISLAFPSGKGDQLEDLRIQMFGKRTLSTPVFAMPCIRNR